MKFENLKDYSDAKFRRVTGVKRKTFDKAVEILNAKYLEEHSHNVKDSGRKPKLSMEEKLLATLGYLREYRTYAHIAMDYGVNESTIYRIIRWVENTLIQSKVFSLPGKKALLDPDNELDVVVIDVSESPIERPKKNQKKYYSGKKKRHTVKTQVVADRKTKKVICTSFSNGSCHDFKMLKESKVRVSPEIKIQADSAYQGIAKIHSNSETPKKKPLTQEEKKYNQQLASERVRVENVIGAIKRFKIISDRYRNRRKRFGLRFNLIAGICNYELFN